MRTATALVITAAALAGCSLLPSDLDPSATSSVLPASTGWMLVAPPEDPAVAALRDTHARLPDGNGATPVAATSDNDAPADLGALLVQLEGHPTANARARHLVERSARRDAPVAQWRRVREFDSAEACNATRQELQQVTREASRKIDYAPGMEMWRLDWAFLEWSNRWSQCVPVDTLNPSAS